MPACCWPTSLSGTESHRAAAARLRDFRRVFVGSFDDDADNQPSDSNMGLPLRSLTAEDMRDAWEESKTNSLGILHPNMFLREFVRDALNRKRPLSSIADLIADCAEDGMLDNWPLGDTVTAKDLFIALIATTPENRQAEIANMALPGPFPLCHPFANVKHEVHYELLYDCFALGDSLIVWAGPAKGKTSLLEVIGLVDPGDTMLIGPDVAAPGPRRALTHNGSVDLTLGHSPNGTSRCWIADAHGYCDDVEFSRCLDTLIAHGMLVLHLTAADFNSKTGATCYPCAPYARLIIWRDYDQGQHKTLKELAQARLPKATFVTLPDITHARPQRVQALVNEIYAVLQEVQLTSLAPIQHLEAYHKGQPPPDTLAGRTKQQLVEIPLQQCRSKLLTARKKLREMDWFVRDEDRGKQEQAAQELEDTIRECEDALYALASLPKPSTRFFLDEVLGEPLMQSRRVEEFRRTLNGMPIDITLDDVFLEAILQADYGGLDSEEKERLENGLLNSFQHKRPVALLQGEPLQMSSSGILQSVLSTLGVTAAGRKLRVISVIGMQSSAKSTLLNFLFGCDFAVSSGRCTRGLYASFFLMGQYAVLVLDSEGLLSVESRGDIFDGQMTLMCLACSHVVIINHKGELTRQLQDLLEISLFALRHLRVTKHKPWINFVLRDQQDRSPDVHEGMLQLMKANLEEAARQIGVPLGELIRIQDTAVFLLPSAYTVERLQRDNREIKWTSALFAQEVLQLRAKIFDMFDQVEDTEFARSLSAWYQHANLCWETLIQYGSKLLHYKTVQEIETKKELVDLANSTTAEVLDTDDGTGFRSAFLETVKVFQRRLSTKGKDRIEIDTLDLECQRALQCLRNEAIQRSMQLFDERSKRNQKFDITMREEARRKLAAPFDWVYENYLYTWKLSLKRANDEQEMSRMWLHFIEVLNDFLRETKHQQSISAEDARDMLQREWNLYQKSFVQRLEGIKKTKENLRHEVTMIFNSATSRLHHEGGTFAILLEAGPQVLWRQCSMLEKPDREWEVEFFVQGWWDQLLKRGQTFFVSTDACKDVESSYLQETIIPKMRSDISSLYTAIVERTGEIDDNTVTDWIRTMMNLVVTIERDILQRWNVSLKRPQFINELGIVLRKATLENLEQAEAREMEKQISQMEEEKSRIEAHFLLIVQGNCGDVEKAKNYAEEYNKSIYKWLDREVEQLCMETRQAVLNDLPDPGRAFDNAYQRSFGARNYRDALEYVLDVNSYVEKNFLTLFYRKKQVVVDSKLGDLLTRIQNTYTVLMLLPEKWQQKVQPAPLQQQRNTMCLPGAFGDSAENTERESPVASEGRISPGTMSGQSSHTSPLYQDNLTLTDFRNFIELHAAEIPENDSWGAAFRQCRECLPFSADLPISDTMIFQEAFKSKITELRAQMDIKVLLDQRIAEGLREQSGSTWSLIRGCSSKCPLCGSKCGQVGEHVEHKNKHHLFPAFHGWMDRHKGTPNLNYCLSKETAKSSYPCHDGEFRNLQAYLTDYHETWTLGVPEDEDPSEIEDLRAAWVNMRYALLPHFKLMEDVCPQEWIDAHEDKDKMLDWADLEKAKSAISRVRNRTYVPDESDVGDVNRSFSHMMPSRKG
eukprot:GEMP01001642.1.p1 GENE.GEMP01001642.1~~GEMP01001642.1.p1  ORF type:complete len:1611 (+),score=383.26 GEMP01001642.1:172-5004(+)